MRAGGVEGKEKRKPYKYFLRIPFPHSVSYMLRYQSSISASLPSLPTALASTRIMGTAKGLQSFPGRTLAHRTFLYRCFTTVVSSGLGCGEGREGGRDAMIKMINRFCASRRCGAGRMIAACAPRHDRYHPRQYARRCVCRWCAWFVPAAKGGSKSRGGLGFSCATAGSFTSRDALSRKEYG